METVKKFDHDGHSFEVKMVRDLEGWQLRIFVDGKPTRCEGTVSDEVQQDAHHYSMDDPRQIIADALEQHIKRQAG